MRWFATVIEDVYRLSGDMLLYHAPRTIVTDLMDPIVSAACTALTLLKEEPLYATLHFLRDLVAYGGELAPSSSLDSNRRDVPLPVRNRVKQLVTSHGDNLVARVMTGMMYSFPSDCFADASGVLLEMFQLLPREVAISVRNTMSMLPAGTITETEAQRFLNGIEEKVTSGEIRTIRVLLQDFTHSYRRRNVAPREGLGALEQTRFSYHG